MGSHQQTVAWALIVAGGLVALAGCGRATLIDDRRSEQVAPFDKPELKDSPRKEPKAGTLEDKKAIDAILAKVRAYCAETLRNSAGEMNTIVWFGSEELEGLKEMGLRAAPAVVEVLKDENHLLSQFAFDVLYEIGPSTIPYLVEVLKDGDLPGCYAALQLLGAFGPKAKEALPLVRGFLQSKDFTTRSLTVRALSEIGAGSQEGAWALLDALKDRDSGIRGMAIDHLAEGFPPEREVLSGLTQALKDEHGINRVRAASALATLDPENRFVVPALIEALQDRTEKWYPEELHAAAAKALGDLGPRAKEALPALHAALKDRDERVARSAAVAIERIEES